MAPNNNTVLQNMMARILTTMAASQSRQDDVTPSIPVHLVPGSVVNNSFHVILKMFSPICDICASIPRKGSGSITTMNGRIHKWTNLELMPLNQWWISLRERMERPLWGPPQKRPPQLRVIFINQLRVIFIKIILRN